MSLRSPSIVAEEVLTDDLLRQVVPSLVQSQELPLLKTNIILKSLLLDQGTKGGFLPKRTEEIDAVQGTAA